MNKKFNYIQVARAVAAIMVVLFHTGGAFAAEKYFSADIFGQLFRFGKYGVEFFFVLSGFIIFYVHHSDIDHKYKVVEYIRKRLVRIYPMYWIVFLGLAFVSILVPSFRDGLPATPLIWIKSLLLFPQDPGVVGGTGAPLVIVAWSLQYELVFYAFFAAFIYSLRLGFLLFIGCFVWWVATWLGWVEVKFTFYFMESYLFLLFGLGVACAYVSQRQIPLPSVWLVVGSLCFVVLIVLSAADVINEARMEYWQRVFLSLSYGGGSALVILGLVGLEQSKQRFVPRFARLLGDASYVMYLTHYAVVSALIKVLSLYSNEAWWMMISFIFIVFVVCVSSVYFHLIFEKPVLRMLNKRKSIRRDHYPT